MTTPDILSFADKALREFKQRTYIRPPDVFMARHYLSLEKPQLIVLDYYEEIPDINLSGTTQVIHGHPVGLPCAAPHFCHEFGFNGNDQNYSPHFRAQFKLKWGKKYGV
jgi:hypothetical protein